MGDAAEDWLQANDPDYVTSRAAWPHLRDGSYDRPWSEVLWDDPSREPEGELTSEARLCDSCKHPFAPTLARHKFCSSACRQAAYRRRVTQSHT